MLQYFYLLSHQHAKQAYLEILDIIPETYRPFVDPAVYSSLQQWRMVGNIKRDTDPQYKKRLIHPLNSPYDEFRFSFAGMVDLENDKLIDVALPITSFNMVTVSNKQHPKRYTQHTSHLDTVCRDDTILKILDIFTSGFTLKTIVSNGTPPETDLKITGYQYLSKRDNIINLARIPGCSSFCHICLRIHDNENAYLYLNPYDGDIRFYCRRASATNYKHTPYTVIGKIPNFQKKILPIIIPSTIDISYENKHIHSIIDQLQENPTICIYSHMGTGKTTAIMEVIKHLAKQIGPSLRVMILGFRRLFCLNMAH